MRCEGFPYHAFPSQRSRTQCHRHSRISHFAQFHPVDFDAGVVVVIFQNSMVDASQLLMEGGSVTLALCGQTAIFWLLDDRLLSFPRRGIDALDSMAASAQRRLRACMRTCGFVVRGNVLCERVHLPACPRPSTCPLAHERMCDTCMMVEVCACASDCDGTCGCLCCAPWCWR